MSLSQAERDCVLTHLYELCRRPNPSGFEDLVRAYIVEHLTARHFSVEVDVVGNVTAWRGVPAPEEGYPLLSFHMDSVTLREPRSLWEVQGVPEAEEPDNMP